jgi:TPR repeat protein
MCNLRCKIGIFSLFLFFYFKNPDLISTYMMYLKYLFLFFLVQNIVLLPAQTIETLRDGAAKGNLEAMNDLAFAYEKGNGVPQNLSESVKWYKKAAQSGYAPAQTNLANGYLAGRGLPKDTVEAVKWYLKAAKQDYAKAQYNLGVLYSNGWSKQPQDVQKSVEWYRKAADNGDFKAMYNIAAAYMEGEGIGKDLQKAAFWSEKSAKSGFALAQLLIGQLYLNGNGVQQNRVKARYWLKRAVLQEVPNAATFLKQAEPENKVEMMGKISDDLCQKFTGPAFLEPAQRNFVRFHFFAKQIFEPVYPDYKQLIAYAPRDNEKDLQKNILIQTFQNCPAFGEKYGYEGDESPFYNKLNAPLCDCVTKRYEKTVAKKVPFKDATWRKMYEQCMKDLVQKDSTFSDELGRAVLDFAQRKNKTNKQAAEGFAHQLSGYFYTACPFIQNQYAQIVVNVHDDSYYETLLFAPERLQNVYEIVGALKNNQKDVLKTKFKTEESFKRNQKAIGVLIKIFEKQSNLTPLLAQQIMSETGMIESFGLVNPKDKKIQYLLKLTFDKRGDMNTLVSIESIAKKDISKQDLDKWQQMMSQMSLPTEKF